MKKEKIKIIISVVLVILAIIFTILVKYVDVKPVGINNSEIGFATINKSFADKIGVNMKWYDITKYLGIIPILMAVCYAAIGAIQLIKRKSIFKVDKEIIILGALYIVVTIIYVLFEKIIINYRPTLIEGVLEASYPSSHTLISICFGISFIMINQKLFKNKAIKVINILSYIVVISIVIGRVISGVHWFTDIIGSIIISSAILMIFNTLISKENNK